MHHIKDDIIHEVPRFLLTDSYKLTHHKMLPERIAYAEFRRSFNNDPDDHRIIFTGLNAIIDRYLSKPFTKEELASTEAFLATHNQGFKPFPFPKHLLEKVTEEHGGWFPVQIHAIPDASVVYPHVPVYTIIAKGEYSGLVTYLETLLTMSWYPSTVATLSRRCRDVIERAFDLSVDKEHYGLIETRLHDFGFRACASADQAISGGVAHLLNFRGTDTLPAAYYSQYTLNDGEPVATSIPASEHSVMMAYQRDSDAMQAIIDEFGSGSYSIVMDTYNYKRALAIDLPIVAKRVTENGGYMVLRPDSGDPVEMTLMGLRAAERAFGYQINSKGCKAIIGAGVIFGDGITYDKLSQILQAVLDAGYSAQNVAFGMGSHLLHKVDRDIMSFATKTCYSEDFNGVGADLSKTPKTDRSKFSLPGKLFVTKENGHAVVYPVESIPDGATDLLELVYDCGPVQREKRAFEMLRADLHIQWMNSPKTPLVLSSTIQEKLYKKSLQHQENGSGADLK